MGLRSSLAKSALKYAVRKFDEFREPAAKDLAPVIARLDRIIERQVPKWVAYTALALSSLTFILVVWILVRIH